MQSLPLALSPFAQFNQWILWEIAPDPKRPGKTNKFPIHPTTGARINHLDPHNQMTCDQAFQLLPNSRATGIGFVFTEFDPFFFIDVDDAFDGSQWSAISKELGQKFAGAAIELSSSGKGAHIFGTCNPIPHGCKNTPLGLELYTSGRFAALTGDQASGDAFHFCGGAFNQLVADYFPPRLGEDATEWTEEPCDGWSGYEDDDTLINKALSSQSAGSAFGDRASFADLWNANEQVLATAFPTNNDVDMWGRSEAEAALCSHLAFWTGRNCARIDNLFRASALMRDKWEREDYAHGTVLLACSGTGDVYNAGGDNSDEGILPGAVGADSSLPQTNQAVAQPESSLPLHADSTTDLAKVTYSQHERFINTGELPEYFKGCVYVSADHAILTPGGLLLDQGRFRATYGGAQFSLDAVGDKMTRNAWEAVTENITLRFPKVDCTTFAPEQEPGEVSNNQGTTTVNSYWPVEVDRQPGDASLFVNHIYKLLPNGDDARILLTYIASLVQNPGHKFQWCPVIQGTEGNGKSIISNCVTHAVGERYTHLPNAKDLGGNGSKFTKWLLRKLYIGAEEIYCADRREMMETLKPLITNSRVEIQGKGADQVTGDNRANWIMLTNHKDAIPLTVDSRRYCIMYCAQQSKEEIAAQGMDSKYFRTLLNWLRKENGFAIVTDYLLTYRCEQQFDPSENGFANDAPTTTSTGEAITLSAGAIEQEVVEAVEQGRSGFCAPWISSMALDHLLKEIRRGLPNAKRPEMLRTLGYVPHPHLTQGRVNNPTMTDGGKTRLYILKDHLVSQLTAVSEISKRYDADQNTAPSAVVAAFGQNK